MHNSKKITIRAFAALMLLTVIWGYNWVVMKSALQYAGPFQFAALRVWVDSNQDGVSQADELYNLSSLGIASINLSAEHYSSRVGAMLGGSLYLALLAMYPMRTTDQLSF